MMKTLVLTVALAVSALLVADANALPLTQGKQTVVSDDVTLVRDGCGRGMRYSRRAGGCVPDGPRGVAPIVVAPAVRVCPPGFRWSNRCNRCVR